MPSILPDTATNLVRAAFFVGAVTDGLAIIPMVSRRVGQALFGRSPSQDDSAYRFAMRMGASLMAGWTVLLLWGAADPLSRRDLLLLTVFPVIFGIMMAIVLAVRNRVLITRRVIPLWIHLGIVSVFYISCYLVSSPFAQ
jgi:predicted neutral ceramidase superfamily lipid hydrolase